MEPEGPRKCYCTWNCGCWMPKPTALLPREVQSTCDLKSEMMKQNADIYAFIFGSCLMLDLTASEWPEQNSGSCFLCVLQTIQELKEWTRLALLTCSPFQNSVAPEERNNAPALVPHWVTTMQGYQHPSSSFAESNAVHSLYNQPPLGPPGALKVSTRAVGQDPVRVAARGKGCAGPRNGL